MRCLGRTELHRTTWCVPISSCSHALHIRHCYLGRCLYRALKQTSWSVSSRNAIGISIPHTAVMAILGRPRGISGLLGTSSAGQHRSEPLITQLHCYIAVIELHRKLQMSKKSLASHSTCMVFMLTVSMIALPYRCLTCIEPLTQYTTLHLACCKAMYPSGLHSYMQKLFSHCAWMVQMSIVSFHLARHWCGPIEDLVAFHSCLPQA